MATAKIVTRLVAALPLALSCWLLVSGWEKVLQPGVFRGLLAAHGLFAVEGADLVAWVVPILEIGSAAGSVWALCRGSSRVAARWLVPVCVALVAYSGALTLHPPPKPAGCGCGLTSAPVEHWGLVFARNSGLLLVVLASSMQGLSRKPQ